MINLSKLPIGEFSSAKLEANRLRALKGGGKQTTVNGGRNNGPDWIEDVRSDCDDGGVGHMTHYASGDSVANDTFR